MNSRRHLRCFAEYSGGVWVAYCLDFGLGAQADTFDEAKAKIEAQISDLSPDEAHLLFQQGSSLSLWARYWVILALVRTAQAFGKVPQLKRRFSEALPPDLVPC